MTRDTAGVNDEQRDLMTVRATLDGREITGCIADLVASASGSDLAGVNDAILKHAQDFAWWSTLEALATDALTDARGALAAYEADTLATADDKTSVTVLKARMRSTARWTELHAEVRKAERTYHLIKVGRETCEENKSALGEVSRNLRAEMDRLLTVANPAARSRVPQMPHPHNPR